MTTNTQPHTSPSKLGTPMTTAAPASATTMPAMLRKFGLPRPSSQATAMPNGTCICISNVPSDTGQCASPKKVMPVGSVHEKKASSASFRCGEWVRRVNGVSVAAMMR